MDGEYGGGGPGRAECAADAGGFGGDCGGQEGVGEEAGGADAEVEELCLFSWSVSKMGRLEWTLWFVLWRIWMFFLLCGLAIAATGAFGA